MAECRGVIERTIEKQVGKYFFFSLLAAVMAVIGLGPGCRDPNDFKPPEDTLADPPPAPSLLSPIDHYVRMPDGPTCRLTLDWVAVPDAERYEIDFTSLHNGSWTVSYDTNSFTVRLEKEPGQYLIDHFTWRVRAANTHWKYYTDYSETRHFEVRYRPPAPITVLQSDDTTLVVDSLPYLVLFDWMPVQDEQHYDLDLFIDSFPLEFQVSNHYYRCTIVDTGIYYWYVRADNPLWQYPSYWSGLRALHIITP